MKDGRLHGWAFAPARPGTRLLIAVETDPGRYTRIVADRYRADVHKAVPGCDGSCGFAIDLARLGWQGPFRIVEAKRGTALRGSPVARERAAPAPRRRGGGCLFALHSRPPALSGWLSSHHDADDLDAGGRRRIVLEIDGSPVARQSACLYRPGHAAFAADDFHGFALDAPPGWRLLRLLDEASGTELFRQRRILP